MAYVTPITDRAASDVGATPTAKGYWNVADWVRVYGNANLMVSLVDIMTDAYPHFTFPIITAPTTLSFPAVADFNSLLGAIEAVRLAVVAENITGALTAIDYAYIAGVNEDAPDYNDANLWESTIDAIWLYYDGDLLEVCPTLTNDVTVLTGEKLIYIDCVDLDIYTMDIQGTGQLFII